MSKLKAQCQFEILVKQIDDSHEYNLRFPRVYLILKLC